MAWREAVKAITRNSILQYILVVGCGGTFGYNIVGPTINPYLSRTARAVMQQNFKSFSWINQFVDKQRILGRADNIAELCLEAEVIYTPNTINPRRGVSNDECFIFQRDKGISITYSNERGPWLEYATITPTSPNYERLSRALDNRD